MLRHDYFCALDYLTTCVFLSAATDVVLCFLCLCSCDGMHLGQHCECEVTDDFDSMKALSALCRQTNKSEICDGHGDCECGKCSCHSHYRGDYCECDDKSCSQDNNMQWCNGKCVEDLKHVSC